MTITALHLFIVISAMWRISSLFANENGPFYIFKRIRDLCQSLCERNWFCKELHLYELIECEWCNSIWFGTMIVIAWCLLGDVILYPALVLAISAWVIFMKFVIQSLEQLQSYLTRIQ